MSTKSRLRSSRKSSDADSQSLQSGSAPQETEEEGKEPRKDKKQGRRKGRGYHIRKPDRFVCVVPNSEDSSNSIVCLKDPKTGSTRKFILREPQDCNSTSTLCEILKFSDEPRSWFIDNSIHTDGSLFLFTPVDPLFVALPYFQTAAQEGKFTTLDVILDDSKHITTYSILSSCTQSDQWRNISETKVIGSDIRVYRYSKERTMAWLKKKVTALAESLEAEKVHVGKGSQSTLFVKSAKQLETSKGDFLDFACGMIGDYLGEELSRELALIYSVTSNGHSEGTKSRRKEEEEEPPPVKRVCLTSSDQSEPLEDYSRSSVGTSSLVEGPTQKMSAKQKSLAKIDKTGMKTLSKFFKKK